MDERAIVRSWTHAYEEDEDDCLVLRPSESPVIRPSRMPRMAFDLREGGRLTTYSPGADDRRVGTSGRWRLEGDHLVLEPEGGPPQRYVVAEASPDKLRLRTAG